MERKCRYNISNQHFLGSNPNPPSFLLKLPIIFGIELSQAHLFDCDQVLSEPALNLLAEYLLSQSAQDWTRQIDHFS